jgi:hypothetical protein
MDNPNNLVLAISKYKNTFKESRIYLMNIFKDKNTVLKFECSHIDRTIPYYIKFIESKDIDFNEAINYYKYIYPDSEYWELIKATIVNVFGKIENKDLTFYPY